MRCVGATRESDARAGARERECARVSPDARLTVPSSRVSPHAGTIGAAIVAAWCAALTHIELSPSARAHAVAVRSRVDRVPRRSRASRARQTPRRDAARAPTDRSTDLARVSSSQAPAYVIAAFALCSLAVIARSVVFFPSCAAEAAALARDVSRARADLLAAGVLTAEDFDRADDASD